MVQTSVRQSIASFRFAPEQWLWCLHCERFFQGRDARPDCVGGVQGCAFPECDGAGYQVDVFEWDEWPALQPAIQPRWPAQHELRKGLHAAAWPSDEELDKIDPWDDLPADPGFVRNTDLARRDALLGLAPSAGARSEARFTGLDLVTLATLVHERFLAPSDRQPFGPPIAHCLELLAEYPELRISGRVLATVEPAGHAIVPESVDAELLLLNAARREQVSEAVVCSVIEGGEWTESDTRVIGRWRRTRGD